MNTIDEIVLATSNPHKREELLAMLGDCPVELCLLPQPLDIVEDGCTYFDNAAKKATTTALYIHKYALAEDSGLAVRAMNGQPSVHSARFFRDGLGIDEILTSLTDGLDRTAHFTCSMVLTDPDGSVIWYVQTHWYGTIAANRSGDRGFGYDPIFVPDGHERTAAELSSDEKNQISHRAKAAAKLRDYLYQKVCQ